MLSRTAFRATRTLRPTRTNAFHTSRPMRSADAASDKAPSKAAVQQGAKRDPELYVLFAIMTGVFGLAGWHFSSNPTSTSSENATGKISNSEPWKTEGMGKYQFHPGGDPSKGRKDAPSALNTVIIPNVNLPKELHDQFNKYGKDDY